ncbi:hypothetical protein R6Q59_010940 [Mikania micrantha]
MSIFDDSSYVGNEDLCGLPTRKVCLNPDPATTKRSNKKNVWDYLELMCGFATGFLGVIGALLLKKQWRKEFYRVAEVSMDNIYVAVVVKLNKIKRRGEPI